MMISMMIVVTIIVRVMIGFGGRSCRLVLMMIGFGTWNHGMI